MSDITQPVPSVTGVIIVGGLQQARVFEEPPSSFRWFITKLGDRKLQAGYRWRESGPGGTQFGVEWRDIPTVHEVDLEQEAGNGN